MKYKRKLFSILILFLMIFSISFVSANENVTNDISTNELSTLSVSNDNTIDENLNSANLNSVDTQNTNEVNSNSIENSNATEFKSDSVEESSSSNLDLEDGTLNTDEIESDDCLTKDGKVTNLRANKLSYDMSLTNGDAQAVMDAIQEISRNNGGTLYLNGQTYGGSAHARVWTGTGYRDIQAGENIYISNVRIVGGSEGNPNQFAKFQPYYENNTALSFAGYSTSLEGAGRYSSNSGVHLTNVTFEYLNCTERFFSFASGSLTNCVFDNLESYQHLFFVIGSFIGSTPIRLTNCNFTNSKQTYVGRLPAGGTDGTGQFGVVFGAEMYGCNFINTSTATHGGAFCLSDEWQSAACVPSKLIDCNFINITSRWFAVYIHGNYTETVRPITEPQVINNCKFINCTGSGEFGGALGISHNNVIINNTEFTNNTGGKGSAIMVGGINNTHDGFLGNNTEGNNITIENCVFKDNLAKTENQSYSNSTNPNFSTYPTGDAGAIYVYGNHTKIIDSTFINNTAVNACGAAIYIEGQNTTVIGSEFYEHESANGTVYLLGNECKIIDSNFHDNTANSSGSCIYVIGNRSEIYNTTFEDNTAPYGGCVYIEGTNTIIGNDSAFIRNNATNGSGVYVIGDHTNITNTSFVDNIAENGAGAFLNGHDVDIHNSSFVGNNASNGGGVFIEGDISIISNNTFYRNNVTSQGGAVYIDGHHSDIIGNNFTANEAVPLKEDLETGLGGAIFVHGDETETIDNRFFHNKARNGSAIYTDGTNFNLTNDIFFENQAWSYVMVVTAVPPESLYHSQDINITVTHRGGDNIINAIHNHNEDPSQVKFLNVTYQHSSGQNITTNETSYVSPVKGVENSENGTLLYQDDRESNQIIQLKVTHEDGEIYYNETDLITDIYGNVNVTLNRNLFRKGKYIVDAEHVEDWNYRFIYNATTFRILDTMDLRTNKTSDEDEYFQDEIATWNITVHNSPDGTDAENVTITDFLPDVFKITNLTYVMDSDEGEWTRGILDVNTSTLRYGVYNKTTGDWVYGDAHYDASTNTWTYYFLELEDDMFTYTVFNPDDYIDKFGPYEIIGDDVSYGEIGYNIPTEDWYYDTINVNGREIRYGHFDPDYFIQYFGPWTWDNDEKTYVYVNETINPENQEIEYQYTYYNNTTGYWVINSSVYSPLRLTLTQKVTLTITEGADNRTNVILKVRDFDKNDTATIIMQTNCTKSGNYTNIVNVTSPDYDWNLSNNEANKTVDVVPLPEKNVTNSTPYYHDYVDYNLTVINTGNETYGEILTVVDSLPVGLTYNNTVSITGAEVVQNATVSGQNVTWKITNIPAYTNATIVVRVYVDALGNLTNNMTLIAPEGKNRTVNATITPQTFTDVSINKTVEKEEYFVNDTILWTITVHVAGNGTNATNVTVYDVLPDEVEFVSSNGTYSNESNMWYIGDMENGTDATIVITTRGLKVSENITNTANVICNETEWDYTNNEDNATTSIIPVPHKTANETNPKYNEYVDYNLTVINVGEEDYNDTLTLIDSLPVGLEYNNTVSINGADQVGQTQVGPIGEDGQKITWQITNIAANTNATVIVRVHVSALGDLINNYTLIGPKGSNRTVNATITVDPNVDLSINKTADKEEYFVNETVYWTITVYNARNATTATNVTVYDVLPEEVEYISSNGTYDNITNSWTIGVMGNGTNATIVITTRALVPKVNVTNTANVTCNEVEWDMTNNEDNATISIVPVPRKTVSNATPDYHEYVYYNLTIINNGNVTYTDNLTVVDSLQEGLTFINTTSITGADIVQNQSVNGQVITWIVTNVSAYTNATITVLVRADAVGELINNYTLIAPKGSNRTVNATIDVQPIADVSVEKTVDKDEYKVNETAIWTITVRNAANGTNATNVNLSDILPKEFEYVSNNGTYNNNTGLWNIGFMENGTSVSIRIVTTAKIPKYNITNTAVVNCSEKEWNYTNNIDNATASIIPVPHKEVNNTNPTYHEIVEYNLTVINYGDEIYTDEITVIDSLEEGLAFINTTSITGAEIVQNQSVNGQVVTWIIKNIVANGNATITVLVQANATGRKLNNLTIQTPKGTNMTVNVTINVNSTVDISVNKTVDKEECKIGENVTWTITVHNAGNGTNATNVTLKDILPEEFEFVSASNASYNNNTGEWYIGFMENGTSVTITINSTAKTTKYNVTNTAVVNCTETEWDYTNNIDNASVNIIPQINKTVDNATPDYHGIVIYNLTVINNGDANYTDELTLIDSLEEGLTYLRTVRIIGAEVVQNATVDGQKITWIIKNIPAHTSAIVFVEVQADAIYEKLNNFTLRTPKGTNDTVNCTIDIQPIVDISVEKTVDKEECKVNETVIWTITIRNAGNGSNATNVNLSDIIPKEFDFVSATNDTYNSTTGVWNIGFMENGTSVTIRINSTAKTTKYNVTNVAVVNCSEKEWNYTNNIDNASVNIIPEIEKTVDNATPDYHANVTYSLIVKNQGDANYTDELTLIDSLEEGLTYLRTVEIIGAEIVQNATLSEDNRTITWIIKNIPAGQTAIVYVEVRADAIYEKLNNFTLRTPKGTNDTVNCTIDITPVVDISVEKTVNKEECKVNETVIWTITIRNAGNGSNATNVNLSDIIPKEFDFVSATNDTYNSTTGLWNIGFMENGTSVTINITSRAKTTKYNVTNIAVVNCSEKEWNYTNNIDNASVNIIPQINKTVDNATPDYHGIVIYNLTVINNGDANYTDELTLIDSLEEGLTYLRTIEIIGAEVVQNATVDGQKITWIIKNIPAHTSAIVFVEVQADAIYEKLNNFTLRTPKGTNDTVNCTIDITPVVDVSVTKTVDKEECKVNETAIWTITVYNAGNGSNATNVTLKDILPKEFEYLSSDASVGEYNSTSGVWYIGFMKNGTSQKLTINSKATTTKYNVTNVAVVNCSEKEWNYTNNIDNASVNIIPQINKTVDNATPDYHANVTYSLIVKNDGDANYTDELTLIDSLEEGLTYLRTVRIIGADVVQNATLSEDNRTITWIITNIPAKSTATVFVEVRADAIYEKMNNFTLRTPKGTNDTVNCTINITPVVDVSVIKTVDKEECKVNETAIWTIVVSNANNGSNATNVTLKDILPKEFEFVSATNGTYNSTSGVWYIGFMENGTSVTINITSRAKNTKYNVTNVAVVNCSEKEWDYTNNIDNATISIIPEIDKTVDNATPDYHENVTYSLIVKNDGDAMYTDELTLIDSLEEGLTYLRTINVTGAELVQNGTVDGQTITWIITNIPAKSIATVFVEVRADAIYEKMNNFTLRTPKGTNDTVNCTINITPVVDVSVTKTVDKEECKVNETAIWTIVVSNANNGSNATNVTLKDILPKEFEFISASNGTYNSTSGVWYIGFMENGTSVSITINSKAISTKYNATNVAVVNCSEKEWNYTNNIDNATISIIPEIDKTVDNATPDYHENVTYSLIVKNDGDAMYTDELTLIDSLEEGLTYLRTINVTGAELVQNGTVDGQTITWIITNIPAKSIATVFVEVRADAIYEKMNNFTLRTPKGTNDTVNCTINITPVVDVSVTKTVDKEECKVNETAIWTIIVSNANNGSNATNVTLKDILPKEFEYVSSAATIGEYNSETGIWYIGFMENGTSQRLTINSKATTPKYNATNVAEVNCTEKEWDYTNNIDNATISIIPIPIKTVNETEPLYHEIVEYNLTVVNYGDSVYTDELTLIDTLEDGLEFIETVSITGADVVKGQTVSGQTITWVLSNIAANGNATITVKVKANAVGTKDNTFTIETPKGTNMSVNITIKIKPYVDVSVTKASDKDVYFLDDIAVWTITVYNAANGTNATNVVLDDLLPSEFEFINYTATKGQYDADSGVWTIGFMENGSSETLTINSLAKTIAGKVTNIANVSCDETEWDYTNNVANKTVEIIDIPDVNKTVNNATPYYGREVVYNITVKNTGNITYTNNLDVIDSLPQGLKFIKTESISGAKLIKEVAKGQIITWTITDIAAKSSAIIKVRVKANALGNLINNATIVDPSGHNKTVNCTIIPVPLADLAVEKTSDHFGIDCHNTTTVIWTIKVVNNGPNTAANAIAKDILPEGLIYISDDSDGAYDADTGIWSIGDLAKGESVELNIETIVDAIDTIINNPVVVSTDTEETNLTNNRDNSSIKVISVADLVLTKNANVTKVHVGDNFTYNITVVNDGPDTAVNVRVYDVLPKGLKLIGFEVSKGSYNPQNGTWTVGDLEYGEEVSMKIDVMALKAGKIINEARVVSDTYDPNLTNNNDSAIVTVIDDYNPPGIPMLPTGNPFVVALLSLLAIVGITLKRKS